MNTSPVKQVSGWLPIAMSAAALMLVLSHVALGAAREPDEGTTAHLWQLLMAGQVPIVAFFAWRWLPRAPQRALPVIAVQAVAALAAAAPVYLLGL